jgi:arylamine N-acetyltransferase
MAGAAGSVTAAVVVGWATGGPVLEPALRDRVLARLGLAAPVAPTAEGLAVLYRAWCANVPFDNVQKRISLSEGHPRLPGGDPTGFFGNFLRDGTGGTCWPTSIAWAALLEDAGFRVRRVVAAMNFERIGVRPGHATTVVELDGRDWLVDTAMKFVEPFELRRGERSGRSHPVHPVTAEPRDGTWVVRFLANAAAGDDLTPCLFLEEGVAPERFAVSYEESRGDADRWNIFNRVLVARRNLADGGALALRGTTLARKSPDGLVTTTVLANGRRDVLVDQFGFAPEIVARLPEDEPEARPPA